VILTVTLNTALDITYRVRELRPHGSHRVSEVTERPGGKGLNVARVLAALGHEVTVTGFTGGATGRVVQDQLTDTPGVLDALVPVSGATRRTIAVVDELTGDTTQLNEPGPTVTSAEWSAFQEAYEALLRRGLGGGPVRKSAAGGAGGRVRRPDPHRTDGGRPRPPRHQRRTPAPRSRRPPRHRQAQRRRTGRTHRLPRPVARHPGRASPGRPGGGRLTGRAGPAGGDPGGHLARDASGPGPRQSDRRGRLGGRGPAVGVVERLPWPDRLARAVALSAATVLAPVAGEFDRAAYEELVGRVAVTGDASAA
jgi:tagatose 6-phosphate kinase